METNLAVVTALTGVTQIYINRLSTTTLCVLNGGTLLLAGRALLADAAVLHLVMEVKFGIVVNRDVDVSNGKSILLVFAAEGGRLFLTTLVGDGLGSEGALRDMVTLSKLLGGARPVGAEVEIVVLAGLIAVIEIAPVVSTLLLVGTLVVVVLGSVVVGRLTVPVGSNLLGGKAG